MASTEPIELPTSSALMNRLPTEIRLMIWEQLLGNRLFRVGKQHDGGIAVEARLMGTGPLGPKANISGRFKCSRRWDVDHDCRISRMCSYTDEASWLSLLQTCRQMFVQQYIYPRPKR